MFSLDARNALRDDVLEMARNDPRVVAAAVVGSLSLGGGDQWSDLDLTFAVDDGVTLGEVLEDWTSPLVRDGAVVLFDLAAGSSVYRVYMFPDCLQLDLSFTPAADFRPTSPRFSLVFGEAGEMRVADPPDAAHLLGWGVMWARHARVCIERGHFRRAEHAISRMRECGLDFACRRRDLPAGYGRGLEQLPSDVYERFAGGTAVDVQSGALKQTLRECVAALFAECAEEAYAWEATSARLSDAIDGL